MMDALTILRQRGVDLTPVKRSSDHAKPGQHIMTLGKIITIPPSATPSGDQGIPTGSSADSFRSTGDR